MRANTKSLNEEKDDERFHKHSATAPVPCIWGGGERREHTEIRQECEAQMKLDWKGSFKLAAALFLLYLGIYYWPTAAQTVSALLSAARPLLLGVIMAYILNILMSFYEKHYFPGRTKPAILRSRRGVCTLLAVGTLCLLVFLLLRLVVPELISSIQILAAGVPEAVNSLMTALWERGVLSEDLFARLGALNWQQYMAKIADVLTSSLGGTLNAAVGTVSAVASSVMTAFLAFIFSVYLLLDRDKLLLQCRRVMARYLPAQWRKRMMYVASILNDCFHRYIVGQCTEAVILGVLCALGMKVFGFPYAGMTGAVIGFTALIPVAGAYIGAAFGALMILTVSPVKAVLFLVYIVVLQQLEGNLIYPRVVGSSIGLPGIWVLAAITIGGGLGGILGMLVSVPAAAALYRLLKDDVSRPPKKRT